MVAGRADLVSAVKQRLDHLGGALDPHACFLLQRGLKTLALRVRHQNRSALEIAGFLAGHPRVRRVHHTGLPDHPQHARAAAWLGGGSGLFSFEVDGDVAAADALLRRLTIPIVAPSLGGPETLITRPATTSHAGLPREIRLRQGISDELIRISVGLEATADLIEDLAAALR